MVALTPITDPSTLPTNSALQILYFHAPWATPCKQMTTVLTHLASTYTDANAISFFSIDAEELPDLAESYDVAAVPHIVIQRGGTTLETVSGGDATKVRDAVEKYANPTEDKRAKIPPQQTVTRPVDPPAPKGTEAATNGIAAAAAAASQTGGNAPAKDLSAYAPASSDPPTAPAFSSDAISNNTSEEEQNKRLSELVKAAPCMLFMKGTPSAPQCGFSRQLVSLLRENSVRYGFFNILADDEVRQGLKKFSDWPTFPQLYLQGELIGGLDIVKEELGSDPDFFKEYAVEAKRNAGGPAGAEAQRAPISA